MNFIDDRSTLVGFYPAEPYNDGLIQLEAMQELDYEVTIDWVSNYDQDLRSAAQKMAERYPKESDNSMYALDKFHKWGRVVIGQSMRPYVGIPDIPADPFSDVAPEDSMLWDHPALLVGMVYLEQIDALSFECQRLMGVRDWYPRFRHSERNYPWLEIVGSCFMRVVDNVVVSLDQDSYSRERYESEAEYHQKMYKLLGSEGIRPINPEQLCGIMVDFYRTAAEEVPEFAELRISK